MSEKLHDELVEWLHDFADFCSDGVGNEVHNKLDDAADEIEHLRKKTECNEASDVYYW